MTLPFLDPIITLLPSPLVTVCLFFISKVDGLRKSLCLPKNSPDCTVPPAGDTQVTLIQLQLRKVSFTYLEIILQNFLPADSLPACISDSPGNLAKIKFPKVYF